MKARRLRKRPLRRLSRRRAAAALVSFAVVLLLSVFFPETLQPSNPETPVDACAPKLGGHLRVCSWNVCNYNVSMRKAQGRWTSYPKPEAERDAVCKVLAEIDADVVLIEEMGDITFLRDLTSRLKKAGKNYPFAVVSKFDLPSRLAVISKTNPEGVFDFSDTKISVKGESAYSPRGALGVKFGTLKGELFLFAVHLKSKVGAKKKDEQFIPFRFAELRAISSRINSVAGGKMFLVAGDFNDEPTPALLRNFSGVKLLPQSDSGGQSYTYHWLKRDVFYRYDFFLVSEALAPFAPRATVVSHGGGSDHRPIFVDVDLN